MRVEDADCEARTAARECHQPLGRKLARAGKHFAEIVVVWAGLVATGRDARRVALGAWNPVAVGLAGLDPSCIPFLHERKIAVLGCDGISDPLPSAGVEGWPIPVHQCCLVGMGVHLLDNLELSRLASACAARSRWEFLFSVAPLRIERATGSPVNPVALF